MEAIRRLYRYNWTMRDAWFAWLAERPEDLLTREFVGGRRGFAANLVHVVGAETRWMQRMQGQTATEDDFESCRTLQALRALDADRRAVTHAFLAGLKPADLDRAFTFKGRTVTWQAALLQAATHEIHHAGQLFVWAREAGHAPPDSSLFALDLGWA